MKYNCDAYPMGVCIEFRGARHGYQTSHYIQPHEVGNFAKLLSAVAHQDSESRKAVVCFCSLLYFNMSKRVSCWLDNSEELSAALALVANEYEEWKAQHGKH